MKRICILLLLLAGSVMILLFSSCGSKLPETAAASSVRPSAYLSDPFSLSDVPAYSGSPWVIVHDNVPWFTETDLQTTSYEEYGELDALGRCTGARACIGRDLMPTEERESISEILPSGWQIVKYDGIDGNYLYNRCHLIAYGLTAENANERNLITGTRYMNTEGMNPFENNVIAYIRNTGHHVLYRVTPIFEGEDLVASGVLMEGKSVEDNAVCFCVYAYNVQPGIVIDYSDGSSSGIPFTETEPSAYNPKINGTAAEEPASQQPEFRQPAPETTYVVNTSSCRFHRPDCSSVQDIKEKNRWDSTDSRDVLLEAGYTPCKICRP